MQNKNLKKIYEKLFAYYGEQGWWPLFKNKKLVYNKKIKSKTKNQKLEIQIGAILAQSTNFKNVEKALFNLIKAKVLNQEKLKKIDPLVLANLIKPSGYFRQKTKKIKEFIFFGIKETKRENLLKIYGIGPETCDSILLYSYDLPYFVIDTYTKRIFTRIGFNLKNKKYDEIQDFFHKNLEKDPSLFNEYHALIVRHAKQHCLKKNPKCMFCPIKNMCEKSI